MRTHLGQVSHSRFLWRALAGAWVMWLGHCPLVRAQDPPAAAPPASSVPVYRLQDCLSIARGQQPAIQAAAASLAAAQTGQQGLSQIRFGAIFAKDLPARRQQAAWGVNAAAANLTQVEYDTNCAVARTYYSVIYAREQRKVAQQVVMRLKVAVANGETLLGKDGAPEDLSPVSIAKAKLFLALSQKKLLEAEHGLQKATAALREAMGLPPGCEFQVAEDKLPEPRSVFDKNSIINLALERRGEIAQAQSAVNVACWEVQAQSRLRGVRRQTAAAGGDMHARSIPTGSFGDDYKPGAIGLDFPTMFVGPRATRVQRASELTARAQAASDKARNLVALDAEDAWLRWEEAIGAMKVLEPAVKEIEANAVRAQSALESGVIKSYRDVLELHVAAAQGQAELNTAKYQHMIALTELERVTAGGYAAGITVMPPPKP